MIIDYLDGLVVDDDWLETLTPEELKTWLEDYAINTLGRKETAWVCPLTNRIIMFGNTEPDWRSLLNGD